MSSGRDIFMYSRRCEYSLRMLKRVERVRAASGPEAIAMLCVDGVRRELIPPTIRMVPAVFSKGRVLYEEDMEKMLDRLEAATGRGGSGSANPSPSSTLEPVASEGWQQGAGASFSWLEQEGGAGQRLEELDQHEGREAHSVAPQREAPSPETTRVSSRITDSELETYMSLRTMEDAGKHQGRRR
jgi:hypothetical protein